ncbi:hypothetical protein ACUUL3_00795 [Thiovibrio sp. JS02]
MICERHGFIQGFLTAVNLYGDDRFSTAPDNVSRQGIARNQVPPAGNSRMETLSYEKYLDIPTFRRQGKKIRT